MELENSKTKGKHDLTGREFGLLTVVGMQKRERDENGKLKPVKWICKCECGNEVVKLTGNLLSGNTRSCGCLMQEYFRRPAGRMQKSRKGKCPHPSARCPASKAGKCCQTCLQKTYCENACLNSPDKCGMKADGRGE